VPGRGGTTPTEEQTGFTGPLLWDAVVEALRRGVVPELAPGRTPLFV
jgi:hypothetical protein